MKDMPLFEMEQDPVDNDIAEYIKAIRMARTAFAERMDRGMPVLKSYDIQHYVPGCKDSLSQFADAYGPEAIRIIERWEKEYIAVRRI